MADIKLFVVFVTCHKQNLINYWNAKTCEEAVRYLQEDYETMFDREKE